MARMLWNCCIFVLFEDVLIVCHCLRKCYEEFHSSNVMEVCQFESLNQRTQVTDPRFVCPETRVWAKIRALFHGQFSSVIAIIFGMVQLLSPAKG